MQMPTSRFESLKMQESKAISEFYTKLCDLSNQAFALGEEYSNLKLLRSLPKRFSIKVIAIEEAKNLEQLAIDEFIKDDHQNFIAFTANAGNEDSNIESCGEINEDFLKTYKQMLGKWAMVCEINIQPSQENKCLKDENAILTNQVAAKEALLVEEHSNMVKINEELVGVKLTLEKFNNKLDELLGPEKGIHVDGV
ncbi:hypothetical protein PVK06_022595 [Gossypium arboreum]|uniref:Gag-pol polyprotein n=1 Tax=Gossypium arboreum TaxID=29729 RepID=A0ABR0P8Y4_GOSAR|nr:hypothetical protein PVK06_022595 [Gossypium arboreum]